MATKKAIVYSHIMIDNETCGTRANSALLSIGAVKFNAEGELGPTFYQAIKIDGQKRVAQHDTIAWWMQQSPEAQAVWSDPAARTLDETLFLLSEFFDHGDYTVWSNGASFDIPQIELAFAESLNYGSYWFNLPKYGYQAPWAFYNAQCYRTMKSRPWAKTIGKAPPKVAHNALGDACAQALHLQKILQLEAKMVAR